MFRSCITKIFLRNSIAKRLLFLCSCHWTQIISVITVWKNALLLLFELLIIHLLLSVITFVTYLFLHSVASSDFLPSPVFQPSFFFFFQHVGSVSEQNASAVIFVFGDAGSCCISPWHHFSLKSSPIWYPFFFAYNHALKKKQVQRFPLLHFSISLSLPLLISLMLLH